MPRDYVHSNEKEKGWKRKSKKRALPKVVLVSILIVLLLLVLVMIFVGKRDAIHRSKAEASAVVSEAKPVDLKKDRAQKKKLAKTQDEPKPINYEFYKMLPRMEVEVPQDQVAFPKEKAKEGYYLLQLASVKDSGAADTFQDKITKAGYNPKVIKLARGDEEWFRVQLGPYKDEQSAQDAQESLQMKNINSLMLFIKTNHH